MRAKRSAPSDSPMNVSAAEAASPASFQPLNAQTRAGARRPSGRESHTRGGIRLTVHDGFVAAASPVATLRPGQDVAGVFACTRKDRLLSRAGTPYLALELRDKTGALPARAFRDADVLSGRFERGDVVQVAGRVERFRDELMIDVRQVAKVPAEKVDPEAFLPVAYRDLDELDGFLEHLAGEVSDTGFAALLARLLGDGELRVAWRRAPCTRGGHHGDLGGLLEHTVAVGTLVTGTSVLHPRLEHDLLLTAALVHALAKAREFSYGP